MPAKRGFVLCVVVGVAALVAVGGVALGAGGQPGKALRPADQALARSIVLRRSDLPAGFQGSPASPSQGEVPRCKGFMPDESDLTLRGQASSPDFSRSGNLPLVSSSADVWSSAAQAKADFQRVVRPGLSSCLLTTVAKALKATAPKGVSYVAVSGSLRPLTGLGQQAATVRLVFTGVSGSSRIPLIADYYAIRKNRVTALIITLNLQTSYALGHRLAALVASRLR